MCNIWILETWNLFFNWSKTLKRSPHSQHLGMSYERTFCYEYCLWVSTVYCRRNRLDARFHAIHFVIRVRSRMQVSVLGNTFVSFCSTNVFMVAPCYWIWVLMPLLMYNKKVSRTNRSLLLKQKKIHQEKRSILHWS